MTTVEVPTYVPGHGLLRGRTAVITAAAGAGIGGATARRFLEEGARVLISDAHARRLKEYEAELAGGVRCGPVYRAALRRDRRAQVRALFEAAVAAHGRLDIVVNNAGLGGTAPRRHDRRAVVEGPRRDLERHLPVHPRRPPPYESATGGVIVNNASVVGWRAQAGQAHYAAAKAGVMALTRCAAIEAAEYGVRVNAVSPSLAVHAHLAKVTTPELLEELTAREAFGRHAEPWEVANVIVFLASTTPRT